MSTYQRFIITGRLGKRPEFKVYDTGDKGYTKFSVAVDRRGKKDVTDWFNVTAFGQNAVFCRDFLDKGDLVLVEGRVEISHRDGGGYWVDVIADHVTSMAPPKRDADEPAMSAPADDRLPF